MKIDAAVSWVMSFVGWTVAGAWLGYGTIWLICKALDGIVFLVGTVLPPFPGAFRLAFAEALLQRRDRKRAEVRG